ncbi:MAG: VOC family protein [Deltaproteobacteria bacterium]|nr:VOC family protein [Deltaproteobacteria bacterium]
MLSHIELNVSDLEMSSRFYGSALGPLGFQKADELAGEYVRFSNGHNVVIVLCPVDQAHRPNGYHRKNIGLSHLAIAVESKELVDQMEDHLTELGIGLLGEGKIETGYRNGYYTLAFEDPDRIMIEVVHHSLDYFSLSSS